MLRRVAGALSLVVVSLTIGYAAGKIQSGQDAKERVFDALEVMSKGEDMSDKQMNKMMSDLQDVSAFYWDRVIKDPDQLTEHDFLVQCSNEALQVALCAGMVGETDLYKNAAKKAEEDTAPDMELIPTQMGEIAGFLLATVDPQLWEKRMGE